MSTMSMSSRSITDAPVGGGLGPAVAAGGLLDRARVAADQHLLAHRGYSGWNAPTLRHALEWALPMNE